MVSVRLLAGLVEIIYPLCKGTRTPFELYWLRFCTMGSSPHPRSWCALSLPSTHPQMIGHDLRKPEEIRGISTMLLSGLRDRYPSGIVQDVIHYSGDVRSGKDTGGWKVAVGH